ncbi:MAG: hypothetical protein EOM52_07050 [Clostridia bacterium]|nr:hypothetical protein [Clostridia bacterium]
MEQIPAFLTRLFSEYPPEDFVLTARKDAEEALLARCTELEAQGCPHDEAETQAMIEFGARSGARDRVLKGRTMASYVKFRRAYPWMIRGGILGLLILPAASALLFRDVDQKARTLAAWTTAIVLLVGYVIAVEYIDYHYRRTLRQGGASPLDRIAGRRREK